MTDEKARRPDRGRTLLVVVLAGLATLSALVAGVSGQDGWIRWPALVVAVAVAVVSLSLSRRRSSLISWYVVTAAVLLYRLVLDLVR